MTISYYYKQLRTIITQRRSSVFWVMLGLILLLDLFVIQKSVRLAIQVKSAEVPEPLSQSVRVNFVGFNQALSQIEENEGYFPAPVVDQSPFGLAPDQVTQ